MSTEKAEIPLTLDEKLSLDIIHGVHATMSNMAGLKAEPQPFVINEEVKLCGDVSGIVSLIQETTTGSLIVSFPKETIFAILSKIYGKPFTEVNTSVKNGVGELTNMIYGVFKANKNKSGYCFRMVVPSVIIGENHMVMQSSSSACMSITFISTFGPFTVSLAVENYSAQEDSGDGCGEESKAA